MLKSFLRTLLWIFAAAAVVVVAAAAVVLYTPAGGHVLAGPVWGAIAGSSGVSLSVDAVSGSLVRGMTFEGVLFAGPAGEPLFEADVLEGRVARFSFSEREVLISGLRVSEARLLLETDESGELRGWSGFRRGSSGTSEEKQEAEPEEGSRGPAWTVGLELSVSDLDVAVRNARAGSELLLSVGTGTASGTIGELASALAGSLSYEGPGVKAPVVGTFEGSVARAGRAFEFAPLRLDTNVGKITAEGVLALGRRAAGGAGSEASEDAEGPEPPSLDIVLTSSHDLSTASPVLGAGEVSGSLRVDAEVSGPLSGPVYSASLRGDNLAARGAVVEILSATLEGDSHGLAVTSLGARTMGGSMSGDAHVAFPGTTSGTDFPGIDARATFSGLRLDRVAALAPRPARELSGEVSGEAGFSLTTKSLAGLQASLDISVSSLAVDGRSLGRLEAQGSASGGRFRSKGSCCGTTFEAAGLLSDVGLERALVTLDSEDLSLLAEALSVPDLSGSASALAEVSGTGGRPTVGVNARSDDLEYGGMQLAPLTLTAASSAGGYDISFALFDSTVTGSALLDTTGRYRAGLTLDGFDLAAVTPDSLRESMALAGRISASAEAAGDLAGAYLVEGSVTDLVVAVRRQQVSLSRPFDFALSPDSLRIAGAALEGTIGSLLLDGTIASSGSVDISAGLRGFDIASASELLPSRLAFPPTGTADGSVRFEGTRSAPSYSARLDVRDFSYAGLELDTAMVDAEGDSSDVLFEFVARSSVAGSISVFGSIPVLPDSLSLLTFDPLREFGAGVICSGFTMDAGPSIFPGVRGSKRFTLDGSAIMAGTADSLSSINGIGHFSAMGAEFDFVELALADTVYFEITAGSVAFEELLVDVTRKRVLGDPAGGRLSLSGMLAPDGEMLMTASASDLDVAHLVRAFGRGGAASLGGRLTAEASVEGSARDPRGVFSWSMESPRIGEFGFGRMDGEADYGGGALDLRRVVLASGESEIILSGRLLTPKADAGPGYDLTVAADRFRLGDLRRLPPDMEKLEGRVTVDLRVTGAGDSVSTDGTLSVEGGKLIAFGLTDAVKNVSLEIEARGTQATLTRAAADVGGGRVTASGLVDLSGGTAAPTFFLAARLESPDFEIKDTLQGELGGHLEWGGTPERSVLRGTVIVKEMVVTRSFGLGDFVGRRPQVIVVRPARDPRANVDLDIEVEVEDVIEVKSNVAKLSLTGGASVGGNLMRPAVSGSMRADGGTFTYLGNDFAIQTLDVLFMDPQRRDPYVKLLGTADVEARTGESYEVTASFDGFLLEATPVLTSVPPLSGPDIVSLLTFGTTFGAFVSGEAADGSSGGTFADLASSAFLSSAFGIAENALERLLRLDRVAFAEEAVASGNAAEADVTLGKDFGKRLRVNYTTAVGRLSNQRVEVSFELMKRLWIETRTDPEGNHAVGLKLQIPFK